MAKNHMKCECSNFGLMGTEFRLYLYHLPTDVDSKPASAHAKRLSLQRTPDESSSFGEWSTKPEESVERKWS